MTGDDFNTLAVDLLSGTSASHFRSSVSRAYYGALHIGIDLLDAMGITLTRSDNCHAKMPIILEQSKDADLKKTMSKLQELRREGNKADYRLDLAKVDTKTNAEIQVRIAAQIIKEIKSHFPGGAYDAKHEACRHYAKNTLRLTIS